MRRGEVSNKASKVDGIHTRAILQLQINILPSCITLVLFYIPCCYVCHNSTVTTEFDSEAEAEETALIIAIQHLFCGVRSEAEETVEYGADDTTLQNQTVGIR